MARIIVNNISLKKQPLLKASRFIVIEIVPNWKKYD